MISKILQWAAWTLYKKKFKQTCIKLRLKEYKHMYIVYSSELPYNKQITGMCRKNKDGHQVKKFFEKLNNWTIM